MIHQVLSALQIPEKAARDTALAAVCRECASVGDVESVLLGLAKISDNRQRDETIEECFETFATSGKSDEATNVIDE